MTAHLVPKFATHWFWGGHRAASTGVGILANPWDYGTPQFNYWVDGWCAFFASAGSET